MESVKFMEFLGQGKDVKKKKVEISDCVEIVITALQFQANTQI